MTAPRKIMFPAWLHFLSIAYLACGAFCAIMIAVDELRHPQHLWTMKVWPLTALLDVPIRMRQKLRACRRRSA